MIIKFLKGDIIDINIDTLTNIFDLKCYLADILNIKYLDIRIFLNGVEIKNDILINNLNTSYLIGLEYDSNKGFKVKKLTI